MFWRRKKSKDDVRVARSLHFWSQIVISVVKKTMKTKGKHKEKQRVKSFAPKMQQSGNPGRRPHLSWDLNYSYIFFSDSNFNLFVAVDVALPSCSLRSPMSSLTTIHKIETYFFILATFATASMNSLINVWR